MRGLFPRGPVIPKDIAARRGPSAPAAGGGRSAAENIATASKFIFPPGYFPPFRAKGFFIESNQAIGPGPVTTNFSSGSFPTFTLPPGHAGYIREISLLVNNLLLTSDIRFRLLIGGGSVEGWDNIQMPQAGMAQYIYTPDNCYIPVPSGSVIGMAAVIGDAVTYNLSFTIRGWHYDESYDDAWKGVAG